MNIIIYFDDKGEYGYPFSEDNYLTAYSELAEKLNKLGVNLYFARTMESYEGGGVFKATWKFGPNNQLTPGGIVKAILIYDKGPRNTLAIDDFPVINEKFIHELCVDKAATYDAFKKLSPYSLLVKNVDELTSSLEKIASSKVVIKPVDGFGGQDVSIIKKSEVNQLLNAKPVYPLLVQEFLDSSKGIPGVVDGIHDLRIVMIDNEPCSAMIRQPARGSLVANLARGGSLFYLSLDKLPSSVFEVVNSVDLYIRSNTHLGRVYSIDMTFANGKPYLIELNSRPGLNPVKYGEQSERFQTMLADFLYRQCKRLLEAK